MSDKTRVVEEAAEVLDWEAPEFVLFDPNAVQSEKSIRVFTSSVPDMQTDSD